MARAIHQEAILTNGYGYHSEVNQFWKLITKYGLSPDNLVKHFDKLNVITNYDYIIFQLRSYLMMNGVRNPDYVVNELIEALTGG